MDCARARKLMPLVSGSCDVTEATRAAVLAHAEACPACRAELDACRRASDALASVRDVPEPPGGWAGIWAGIAEHVAPQPAAPARGPSAGPGVSGAAPAWGRRLLRVAATLVVGFSVGFTAYHVGFRPEPDGGPVVGRPTAPGPAESVPPAAAVPGSAPVDAATWRERVGLIDLHPQPGRGWTVRRVQPGSPASVSGLLPDDVLESLNNVPLPPSADELDAVIRRQLDQNEVRVRVLRGGVEQEMMLRLRAGKGPAAEPGQ